MVLVVFQEAFSDIALFFYDVYGGNFVGVVWKPHSFVPTHFKVQEAFSGDIEKESRVKLSHVLRNCIWFGLMRSVNPLTLHRMVNSLISELYSVCTELETAKSPLGVYPIILRTADGYSGH